jgi:uncharacterized protein YndB with AHSA1/START domain
MAEQAIAEQAIVQQTSGPEQLIVTSFYKRIAPAELFRHWTQPELLTQWWPAEAELEPRMGGRYCLSWPSMSWHLRGIYTEFEPGRKLAFTWKWDHEPATPERHVHVAFEPIGDIGTQLTITHGTYANSQQDQQEREGHLEGWTYFLRRLHDAVA